MDSQFRVTYSLLLNLLRLDNNKLRVEDVLKRSFVESSSLREASCRKERLASVSLQMKNKEILNCQHCMDGNLQEFFLACKSCLELNRVLNKILIRPRIVAGVYVIFSYGNARNALGVVANVAQSTSGENMKTVTVFTVRYQNRDYYSEELSEDVLSLYDLAFGGYQDFANPILSDLDPDIVSFDSVNILTVSGKSLKPQTLKLVQEEMKRRETPKIKNTMPDENISGLVREIQRLSLGSGKELALFDPCTNKDINLSDLDVLKTVQRLKNEKTKLKSFSCIHCLCFREHVNFDAHAVVSMDLSFYSFLVRGSAKK